MQSLRDISVQFIKGVGPARKKLFVPLGVENVEDLLYLFPRRYEDRRNITPISEIKVGELQTVTGIIVSEGARRSWYTKKHVSEIVIEDKSGRLRCMWFNQPYLKSYFKEGRKVVCYGRVDVYKGHLEMVSPEYEVISDEEDDPLSLKRIVPVYPLTRGITQRFLRKIIKVCLEKFKEELDDGLPVALRNKHHLYNIKRSIEYIHFPESFEDQEAAMKRISFEEFFFFQLSVIQRRLSIKQKTGFSHKITDSIVLGFINSFSFKFTASQQKVIREIRKDMEKRSPMLRLLQGDVGCGKTVVAFFGCFAAKDNGNQSCIMAPTEILARQHYDNIQKLIRDGVFRDLRVALLVSNLKKKDKDLIVDDIKKGKIDLVVGTHALISKDIIFKNLSFAVIDEQHKFGVRQRALLAEKGLNPDVLIMTATPIPRTLCITLYGDLDISIINEMPPGRGKIKTMLFPEEKECDVYDLVKDKLRQEQQAYFVYPIIEGSEKLDLKAAEDMAIRFKNKEFKDFSVALVHGRMKQDEAEKIMNDFKNGKVDVLVATTVLEVGIDVPNATVMVVENASRFGLSQLHQLRGRIGRGEKNSLFLLVSDAQTRDAKERLKAIMKTNDGFKIAQHDLEIRGPGSFFGRHQHGLNELKVANPITQLEVLELARKEAILLTEDDPKLIKENNKHIKEIIRKRYPTYLSMAQAG